MIAVISDGEDHGGNEPSQLQPELQDKSHRRCADAAGSLAGTSLRPESRWGSRRLSESLVILELPRVIAMKPFVLFLYPTRPSRAPDPR